MTAFIPTEILKMFSISQKSARSFIMEEGEAHAFPHRSDFGPFAFPHEVPMPEHPEQVIQSPFVKLFVNESGDPQSGHPYVDVLSVVCHDRLKEKKKGHKRQLRFVSYNDIFAGHKELRIGREIRERLVIPFVFGKFFQVFVGLTVLLNVFVICLETDKKLKWTYPRFFQVSDSVCLVVFVLDLGLRMFIDSIAFWTSIWNWFDLAIVVIPFIATDLTFVTAAYSLRVFKVARALRAFKSIVMVDELQVVFLGFVSSLHGVLIVLLVVFVYSVVTAFVGLSMFGDISDAWFGSFSRAWYTVGVILSSVGWSDPYYAVMNAGQEFLGQLYFAFSVLIGAKMLMTVMNGAAWNGLKQAKEKLLIQEDEIEEEAALAWVDITKSSRPMRNSPHPNDVCWTTQRPREVPKVLLVPPELLAQFYMLTKLLSDNETETSRLIEQFEKLSSGVIKKSTHEEPSEDANTATNTTV